MTYIYRNTATMKIFAKSNPEAILQEHINDTLLIADVLRKSFTNIVSSVDAENFRTLLRTSVIFRDLGKSHSEFQKYELKQMYSADFKDNVVASKAFFKNSKKVFMQYLKFSNKKEYCNTNSIQNFLISIN
ncbi:MAG: hypothetical protein GXO80_00920 [Chlorobi bacterium]|nr:hypothetical protein [Chlorobiota bacterium]